MLLGARKFATAKKKECSFERGKLTLLEVIFILLAMVPTAAKYPLSTNVADFATTISCVFGGDLCYINPPSPQIEDLHQVHLPNILPLRGKRYFAVVGTMINENMIGEMNGVS